MLLWQLLVIMPGTLLMPLIIWAYFTILVWDTPYNLRILKAFTIRAVKTALAHVSNIMSHFQSHICIYVSIQRKANSSWLEVTCVGKFLYVLLDGEVRTYKMLARFIEQQQAVCAVLLKDSSD